MIDIKEIRKGYPILEEKIQLSSCSQSAMHINVKKSVENYMNSWETEGMNWDLWMKVCEDARNKFAKLINAKPSEIAIVSSVSHAISAILTSLEPNKQKNEIIIAESDFPCVGQITSSQEKFNIQYSDPKTSEYSNKINNNTFLTFVPHVSFYDGSILDIKKIKNIAHEQDSYVFVDAYQSAGQIDIDVKDMDVDFLATGLQKYMLGLPGIAFLYIKEEIAEKLVPKITGWFGQADPFAFDGKNISYATGARRFDSGTFPMLNGFAADSALSLLLDIGVANIESYLKELSEFTIDCCKQNNLDIKSTSNINEKGSTTAIKVSNANEIEKKLKDNNILVSARKDVIRIAPHYYNTKQEIQYTIEKLKQLIS